MSNRRFSGFSDDLMQATRDGELRLRFLGGLLSFVDQAHTISQGISAALELKRSAAVAADLDSPFPVSEVDVNALLDLAAVASEELTGRAEELHHFVNERGEVSRKRASGCCERELDVISNAIDRARHEATTGAEAQHE